MAKPLHILTPVEEEIFAAGVDDPNITLGYLFSKPGGGKFQLDYNFAKGKEWQYDFVRAAQTLIVAIGGIGTGKTLTAGMGACYHGVQTPGFKFLNIAGESWKSELMYNLLKEFMEDTPMADFVSSMPMRPHPKIVIEYLRPTYIKEDPYRKIRSTLEFMSLGEKGDATNVFSWRGDWINIEEAGLIDNLSLVVANLSTRLTGNTADQRPFMGRLSLISNPWENPELWEMLDLAATNDEQGLAFELETKDNMNVTEQQLKNSLALIPESERERYVTGKRPDGRGTYFPKNVVHPCEDDVLSASLAEQIALGTKGYVYEKAERIGCYHYEFAPQEGRTYFLIGDPGTGEAPKRNAPVWMVFDVTEAPKYTPIVAMWWGNGGGSITPFLGKMIEWIEKYKPIIGALDSTSTQKNMAEVVNMEYINGKGYSIEKLVGLDFSGGRRFTFLVCLKIALENMNIKWPKSVVGIGAQLTNYDPHKDKSEAARLAQDLVATMGMGAFAIRAQYGIFLENNGTGVEPTRDQALVARRQARNFSPNARSVRGSTRQTVIRTRR